MGLDEVDVVLRFAHCECGSIHSNCKIDVLLQGPAGITLGHDEAVIFIQPTPKSPHQADVVAGGMVAGVDELLHTLLQTSASLKNKNTSFLEKPLVEATLMDLLSINLIQSH